MAVNATSSHLEAAGGLLQLPQAFEESQSCGCALGTKVLVSSG